MLIIQEMGMSILLCPIYKLNGWFSGVNHPVKIILSISQQLRVVIAPGPQFPSSVFTERKRQHDLPACALHHVSEGSMQGTQPSGDMLHFDSNFPAAG